MIRYKKAIVASGHQLVSEAAAEILRAGGNAFDSIVSAGFASAVVEPTLNSLGGGGFLVGRSERFGQELFFDFFVDTPGYGVSSATEHLDFYPVTVTFSGSSQVFNVGLGSVAVPGTLKGLVHIQRRLGRMTLQEVLEPARELARGHLVNEQQAHFLGLLQPIMLRSSAGRALYEFRGTTLPAGATQRNSDYAALLDRVAGDGGADFYQGEIGAAIAADMKDHGGLLTRQDLERYTVHERKPLRISFRGRELVTAADPSLGGVLVGLSLLLDGERPLATAWDDTGRLLKIAHAQRRIEELRAEGVDLAGFVAQKLHPDLHKVAQRRLFPRGTTHISIADREGNCAAMTCSNGEGSGYFAPGTGVMLNNMMGEDDLHPDGFHAEPPGQRVASMMAPSLVLEDEKVALVIGSGGSKRIRTALSQVISQIADCGRGLCEAVDAPRMHWDGSMLQVEPGIDEQPLRELHRAMPVKVWSQCDVYFGGVHAVAPGICGAGDQRRGGSVVEVWGDHVDPGRNEVPCDGQ